MSKKKKITLISVFVAAVTGADEIPLQDGDTYNFTLKQGWQDEHTENDKGL